MSELSPAELLQCRGQAFGHSLSNEARSISSSTLTLEEEVQNLRINIQELISSTAEHHMEVARSINDNFSRNDRLEFDIRKNDVRRVGPGGILKWLSQASEDEFIEFAQWNVERRNSLAERLMDDRDILIGIALAKAGRLAELNFFSKEALDSIMLASERFSPFAVMDSFESGVMQARGYFDTERISIANLYKNPLLQIDIGTQLQETVFHELLHAAGYLSEKGFLFHKNPIDGRLWEEAFIAHSTAVAFTPKLIDPQLETYDHTERKGDKDATYSDERLIMGHLSSRDIGNIPADLWADAFFDGEDNYNQRAVAQKLRLGFKAINSSEDAFYAFNEAYESTWSPFDRITRSTLLTHIDEQVRRFRGDIIEHEQPKDNIPVFKLKPAELVHDMRQ